MINFLIAFLFPLIFSANNQLYIIPRPHTINISSSTETDGWHIQNDMQIGYDPSIPNIEDFVKYVIEVLKIPTGFNFLKTSESIQTGLYFGKLSTKNNEYSLTTTNDLATIYGSDTTTLFYGFQTLLQLLPPTIYSNKTEATDWIAQPLVTIHDFPKFKWRGVMVDTSRHFFSITALKQLINGMSHYKLNVLHLHLNDDQGWRLQINKYPNLTKYGSVRESSPKKWDRYVSDNTQYGPFYYTEDEMIDLVNYASQRMVTIIPEIQMPGHAMSILSAFPQYACTSNEGPFKPSCFWDTNDDCVLCVGNDKMIEIVENILNEVIRIFSINSQNHRSSKKSLPSVFLHIGANDASRKKWKTCQNCNERMDKEDLSSVDQLHSWFVMHIAKFLEEKNVRIVGCDNILDSKGYTLFDLPKSAVVMSWRSNGGARVAAELGYEVVMSPSDRLYLDYSQFKANDIYEYIGESVTTKMIYHYDPLEDFENNKNEKIVKKDYTIVNNDDLKDYVIGAQACLWSQFIWDSNDLFYKAFPRLLALSESTWCEKENKNWERFMRDLDQNQFKKLHYMGFQTDTDKPSCAQLSFSNDDFASAEWKKGEFSTSKWLTASFTVSEAFNKYGQYEIAFIHVNGEDSIKMRNVKLLINDVVVDVDDHEGSAGNPGVNNIYSVTVKSSPQPNDKITIYVEALAEGGTDSEGRIHVYPADLRN